MRALTDKEVKLIEASRIEQQKRQRNRRVVRISAMAAVILIAVTAVFALAQRNDAVRQQRIAELHLTVSDSGRLMGTEPGKALMLAIAAVGRTRASQQGRVIEEVRQNLALAIERAREESWLDMHTRFSKYEVAFSRAGLIATGGDAIRLWDRFAKPVPARFPKRAPLPLIPSLPFSPDGKLLVTSDDLGPRAFVGSRPSWQSGRRSVR